MVVLTVISSYVEIIGAYATTHNSVRISSATAVGVCRSSNDCREVVCDGTTLCSTTELEKLLNDDATFETFFSELEQVKSFRQIRMQLKEGNEEQASMCL